ncbi:hypothetical protein [Streptomyces sp. NPDC007205]|uniref:hypothetical protein n=1 Tax=Streptomyces sp. NPDC007205 TaxID=3154316 RepID=UPI0033D1A7F8
MDSQNPQSSQPSRSADKPHPPHRFQVDLRGLVDLLSHHLYTSPRVYLRELLQELIGTAAESLYGQALLMAQRPLRPADSALLNRAFINLLEWATHGEREDR